MYSYTTGRNLYGRLTNADDSTHLTNGDDLINQSIFVVLGMEPWPFLEKSETVATVASQRAYEIPANLKDTLDDVYVDVSDTIYTPTEVDSSQVWKQILGRQSGSSTVQDFWYRRASKVEFDPIPSANGNTIYFIGRRKFGGLYNADYTTGTVSISAGGTAVTGSGTTFTSAMVGRYIKFTTGDNLLYEIASYTSATSIALVKPYEGSAVSGGTYTIGEYAPMPYEYAVAPIYRAVALYWDANGDAERGSRFWQMYDGGYETGQAVEKGGLIGAMYRQYNKKSQGHYIPPLMDSVVRDPNVPPLTIDSSNFT